MKKILLSLALCISLSLASYAQNPQGKQQRGQSPMKELNLTSDQQSKMKSINEDFKMKLKELRSDKSLSKEDVAAKGKDLRENHKAQIAQILTPEQQTRLAELRKDMPKDRKDMAKKGKNKKNMGQNKNKGDKQFAHHGKRGGHNSEFAKLNLTEDQKNQLKALNQTSKQKREALASEHKTKAMAVLTPEQQTKLKELRIEKMAKRAKVTTEGATKLQALNENFKKEKDAVEKSRIAPEMQKQRITELKEKYKTERKQIIKDNASQGDKPA